jgi:GNAT superfamily N-acetyltransferase
MRTILNDVEIALIDGDASAFAAFAFPQRRDRLKALDTPWVAIGARWRGAPVGLAVARIGNPTAWLESIMVAAPLRGKGIGTALLASLADHVRVAGASRIDTEYSGFLSGRVAFEALLAGNGWQPPALIDIQLVGLAGAMADGGGAWRPVQRAMRDLGAYSVEPFALTEQDGVAIDALLASAPELCVPDPRANASLDPEMGVTLRHRGELIGWIAGERLTHSMGFGTLVPDAPSILYSGARLADGHPRTLMLVGYYRAFSRQAEIHGPASRAVYRTHPRATAMYKFTRARFEPMALHVEERFGASRSVGADHPSHCPSRSLLHVDHRPASIDLESLLVRPGVS